MSDNSNSTGSSGSSTNSWTLLSPEEAAVENVGPADDGTESLGDVPSLSEEMTGAAAEFKLSDISVETILSEEGHQVCQETSPESSESPIPCSLAQMSPFLSNPVAPPDVDLESQPPVIHDIVTSSPSDNEILGATSFVTNIDLGAPRDIPTSELLPAEPEESSSAPPLTENPVSTEQVLETPADIWPFLAGESLVVAAEPEVSIPTETLTATDLPSHVQADVTLAAEDTDPSSQRQESLVEESLLDDIPAPETVGSVEEEEELEHSETVIQDERGEEEEEEDAVKMICRNDSELSSGFDSADASGFDDGLRRRYIPSFDAPRPRTSDDEDEDEEVEFKMAEKKEGKSWFSLNKCIVGALILLFLGSLFLSGDFDTPELNDGEQSQDWLSSDPQDMKELLDKLTQQNQQFAQLEAQIQKEQLDSAASGDEKGKAGLENENAKLEEELSSLPELKEELEILRATVTELSQLTGDQETPPAASILAPQPKEEESASTQKAAGPENRKDTHKGKWLKDELKRQRALLEESRKRLEGMIKDGGDRKGVWDHLEAIQRKLSENLEWSGGKKPRESRKENEKGKKAKSDEWDHWKKEEKKKWKGEKDKKHSKEGEWREKEEKTKEHKSQKQNSHKEAWRKHQDEWEKKKGERRMDREERRKEKPWHSRPDKDSHKHHQHHQQNDFWTDQEKKLGRNIRPQLGCRSVEDCAAKEGLYPVELPEFEELLEGYLSKLEGFSSESKDKIRKLTAEFFEDGVFVHDRVRFSDFAEDVADVLEDMVDVSEKNDDSLEEEMEEFEREALWKFAATA